MHDVGVAAHEALQARSRGGRAVALLALEPRDRRLALETGLAAAGFEVRHGPSHAGAPEVPAVPGPDALVLLGGVARPDDSTPATVAAFRQAGWDHVVVVGGDTRATVVAHALGTGARGFLVAPPAAHDAAAPEPVHRPLAVNDVTGRERALTAREVQVLALAADGLSNPEIAGELGLSALTVKSHLARMTRRLGARDRAHLVLLALRAGVIA